MERKASRIIIETLVRKALRDIKDSPERSMRNLVDMALHFSQGRFQQRFFAAAQTMLQNEQSAYYDMVQDLVNHVDPERILRFGMDLGYNSCTYGANTIRCLEEKEKCNIPWTIFLQVNADVYQKDPTRYHDILSQGETLGVYTWLLFGEGITCELAALAQAHLDSAFVLFCAEEDLSADCLDTLSELNNVMLVLPYEEARTDIYTQLRLREMMYSVYIPYHTQDVPSVLSGELFYQTQQIHPVFTVLIPASDCFTKDRQHVYDAVLKARNEQRYRMIPWELVQDTLYIDRIISQDTCLAIFDSEGFLQSKLHDETGQYNLFDMDLLSIFRAAFPKDNIS